MSKFQVPTVGGIRKVIRPADNSAILTTISEAIAQLAALVTQLQTPVNTGGGNIGTGNEASIALGPGLSGGGTLVGNVPINLTIPAALFVEDGADGDPGPPGAQGPRGLQGIPGQPWFAEDGADGDSGLQGIQGIQGIQGVIGTSGAAGLPGYSLIADDSILEELLPQPERNSVGPLTINGPLTVYTPHSGLIIQAGTTAADNSLAIKTSSGVLLFFIDGSGNIEAAMSTQTLFVNKLNSVSGGMTIGGGSGVTFPGSILVNGTNSCTGATPGVTVGQTDLGTTTTTTVITTAGGVAIPALAKFMWLVNVNGTAVGIPCFAL